MAATREAAVPDRVWVIHKRWDDIFRVGSTISLIQRHLNTHYAPQPVLMKQFDTQRDCIITAQLSGFQAADVHVDLHRDRLIILAVSRRPGAKGECYGEVLLPAGINRKRAEVKFSAGRLTVKLPKRTWGLVALRLTLAKFMPEIKHRSFRT